MNNKPNLTGARMVEHRSNNRCWFSFRGGACASKPSNVARMKPSSCSKGNLIFAFWQRLFPFVISCRALGQKCDDANGRGRRERKREREREREDGSFKEGKKTSMAGIRGPRNFISYRRSRGLFLSHLPKRFSPFLSPSLRVQLKALALY